MKIEKQVASLEDAKKFKELGIDFGETAFVWVKTLENKIILAIRSVILGSDYKIIADAPTILEMIDKLPYSIDGAGMVTIKIKKDFYGKYEVKLTTGITESNIGFTVKDSKTPTTALSKLLIWAKQEGYK